MANDNTDGSDEGTDSREMGIDFGALEDELQSHEYPVTREELLDEYGEYEIETSGGSETLQSILGAQEMGAEENETEEYESVDEVHQAVLNMIGSEAVGRKNYSDRGGVSDEEDGGNESL